MKLNTKSTYGARAVVEIAQNYGDKPTKRKDIVQHQNIPESYLENILISLKKSGIVGATRGPKGGFVLKRPPSQITMLDVISVFENKLSPVDCLDTPSHCEKTGSCLTRPVWAKLKETQEDVLRNFTIQQLIEKGVQTTEIFFDN